MKKVLSLVLALVMVLGSFSFVSAAPMSDIVGTANEDAITRLANLALLEGYPDGTFKPANNITRAEFAAVMVRAKGLDAVAATAKGLPTGFADVPAYHWAAGYVGTASKLGIIIGDGKGNFKPEDPVKYEEAITMVVRALGYEQAAIAKGGYPYGYLIVAKEIDLLDDAKGTQGLPATRAFVAQITDNALEIPMMIQTGFGTDTKWVVSGTNDTDEKFLLDEMGFDTVEGRVEKANTDKNTITVGKEVLDVAEGFDFYEVEGVEIKAWVDGDEVIVYTLEEDVLFDAIDYVKADKELTLVGADDEYDVDADAILFKNGDKQTADFEADYAKVVLNEDGDVIRVFAYDLTAIFVAKDVEDEVVLDVEEEELDLEDYTLVKDGKTLAIADLEAGDVILYNASEDFAVVYNNSVEGTIDRVYTGSFRLEGKTYDVSGMAIYLDDKEIDLLSDVALADFKEEGKEVEMFFDFEGDVVLVVGTRGKAKTTTTGAILTEDATAYTSRNQVYLPLDMINKNDEKVSFDADKDVKVFKDGGATKTTVTNLADIYAKLDVVEYKVDEDGDLTEVKELLGTDSTTVIKTDARYAAGQRLQSSTVVFLLEADGFEDEAEEIVKYKVDEVFTWADADDFFGEIADYTVYSKDGRATYLVVYESDASADNEEVGFLVSIDPLQNGDETEIVINIDGKEYEFVVDNGEIADDVEEEKFVAFLINDDKDEVTDIELVTEGLVAKDVFALVSARNKEFTIDTGEFELASDAVVLDITGSGTKIITLSGIENGDKVSAMLDEDSDLFVKYLVREEKKGTTPETPGEGETYEFTKLGTVDGNKLVELDGEVYVYVGTQAAYEALDASYEAVGATFNTVRGEVVVTAIIVPAQ